MLVNVNLQEGFNTAEKIRKTVELNEFAQNVPITVSIGLEEYNGEKISELFEKADKKLYAAKRGGRNRTVM